MTKVAFISGHIDLTQEQFETHYVHHIDKAIENGCAFVVGNALGCDALALRYLSKRINKDLVTVYHRESPYDKIHKEHLTLSEIKALGYRNIISGWPTFDARDAAMTSVSDFDIAWVRPDSETKTLIESLGKSYRPNRISGTLKNLQRRSQHLCSNQPERSL